MVQAYAKEAKSLACRLVMDEMAVYLGKIQVGYINYGTGIDSDAKEAFVILLFFLNCCLKIPIVYFSN